MVNKTLNTNKDLTKIIKRIQNFIMDFDKE